MMREQVGNESGFTLLETVFVLFLLSLFCTLALPSFSTTSRNKVEQQFGVEVREIFSLARSLAVSQEKSWRVLVLPNQIQLQQPESNSLRKELAIPKQCKFTDHPLKNEVIFRQTGQAVGGTLTLDCESGYHATWKVQVGSGRVIMEERR
ncbi:Tfp pilus assembly protein FimT [Croceifilum oryzae]|uniref:Tfp pilus assembly protein FimT n=1 Tax=Croceifilum oryzae TaxID=1553429 RepID=A0AAJ1TCF4_9BACL|nr:hypothetical protein [Croceifilum oryzae]MDQ0416300.1 Tfp pilus assembly protein FimT [Croceifilum oryzae]